MHQTRVQICINVTKWRPTTLSKPPPNQPTKIQFNKLLFRIETNICPFSQRKSYHERKTQNDNNFKCGKYWLDLNLAPHICISNIRILYLYTYDGEMVLQKVFRKWMKRWIEGWMDGWMNGRNIFTNNWSEIEKLIANPLKLDYIYWNVYVFKIWKF